MDPNLFSSLMFFVVFMGIFYLMIFRPQKKREKKERDMRDALKEGDNIITVGGIIAKVINIKDDEITVESGVDRTKIKVLRSAIRTVEEAKED
ncbi:MAG: preprotein translocase subunit YajC [Clostridiaceae bacterium]|nr:preprotein translocase subunit YajC [Clostridiaceae bacterium]